MSGDRLAGRRVLVTRTREAAAGLVDALHAEGATVVVVPLITTVPLASPAEVQRAIAELQPAPPPRWVAVTSAAAARLLTGAADLPSGVLVAAVGEATAAALCAGGWRVDVQGSAGAAALADSMNAGGVSDASDNAAPANTPSAHAASANVPSVNKEGLRSGLHRGTVLFPAAEGAHDELPRALEAAGATVRRLILYRTEMPADAPRRLAAARRDGPIDAVVLTSGSTARHLVTALAGDSLPSEARVVCIGRRTAADAESAGLRVDAVASDPTAAAVVAALCRQLSGAKLGGGVEPVP